MTLWQRIRQGIIALTGETVITNLSGLFQAMLVFRYLTVAEYGQLVLLLSVCSTSSIFLDLGMGAVFGAEIAKGRGAKALGRVRRIIALHRNLIVSTGLIILLGFVFASEYLQNRLWAVGGVYVFLLAVNNWLGVILEAYTRYRRSALQKVIRSLSRLALLLTLPWWSFDLTLLAVTLTYPLMELVTLLISIWLVRPTFASLRRVAPVPADLWAIVRQQGVYVILTSPFNKINNELPVWMLQALSGEVAVGIFGAAQRAFRLTNSGLTVLERLLFPLVSEQSVQDTERIKIAMEQIQKYTFWLGLIGAIVLVPLTPWIVFIIAGADFMPTVPVLQCMLMLLVIRPFGFAHRPLFYALGQQRWLLYTHIGGLPFQALMLWLLILPMGAIGAAVGTLSFRAAVIFTRHYVLYRLFPEFQLSLRSVFMIREFDKKLFSSIISKIHR